MILRRLLLAVAMLLTVGSSLAPVATQAAAADCQWPTTINGRNDCYGYFTGAAYPFDNSWGNVITNGMEVISSPASAAEADFYSKMSAALNGASLHDNVGAAFLIDVMLGMDGPNFNCPGTSAATCRNNGISWARTHYAAWAKIVHYYNSKGLVDWNYGWVTPCPYYENSAYSTTIDDVTYHSKTDCGRIIPAIRFFDPTSGTDMMIERICANMLGNANRLNIPNYTLDPNLSPGTNTPAFGGTVSPYDGTAATDYHLTAWVHNTSTIYASDRFQMQVGRRGPGAAYTQEMPPGSVGAYDTTFGIKPTTQVCNLPTDLGCWYWEYGNGMPANAISSQTDEVHFRVLPGAPEGTQICFDITIDDWNFGDIVGQEGPFCFTVHSPRFVSVQGHNSDIHAGGGVCNGASSSGAVTGNASAIGANGTYGDYVVSASAAAGISGIGSNGTTTSPTSDVLKVGSSGAYAPVCRPDLVKAAQAYQASGAGWQSISGAVNVGALNPSFDVYFATGPVTLSGTVNRKITIVSLSSDVTIGGNLVASGGSSRNNLPSLGIIAAGNVYVLPTATTVDAYIFANGDINTCNGLAVSCNNTLTVHGFLMAHSLTLRRLGPAGTNNSQIGENVILSPQIYLNPPKLFDASVDDILLEGQGEKRPLF